jgi:glycosyltransferase involved in cell wall biosynthesis
MKKISIVTPCLNEEKNIEIVYSKIRKVMSSYRGRYNYEHIVIDNCSQDDTQKILKKLAGKDKNLKCIFNTRNFGPVRSPYHGILQSSGDAVIMIASDLQDPPELIYEYIKKWEDGYDVVLAVKPSSDEFFLMKNIRTFYYKLLSSISDAPIEKNATGAGLYDRKVIDQLILLQDPYPYFRGLICDLGYKRAIIPFNQPKRIHGKTSTNFSILFDQAFLAMTKHSKLPIRLMTLFGFIVSIISIVVAFIYLVMKLFYWNSFDLGIAPILISIFLFFCSCGVKYNFI